MSINNAVKTIYIRLTTEHFWSTHLPAVCKYLKNKFGEFNIVFDFSDEAHLWIGRNHARQPVNLFEYIHHSLSYANIPFCQATLISCNTKITESYNNWYNSISSDFPKLKNVLCENYWFYITSAMHGDISNLINYGIKEPHKEKVFTCFNGAPRFHRLLAYMYLKDMNLIDQSYTTMLAPAEHVNSFFKGLLRQFEDEEFPVTLPNSTDTSAIELNSHVTDIPNSFVNAHVNSYFDVVIETSVGNLGYLDEKTFSKDNEVIDPYSGPSWWQVEFFTEKICRALFYKRPFMLIGAQGQLQTLRDQGFKTFDDFWSEDYDNEPDFYKRLMSVICQTRDICNQTPDQIHSLFMNKQMQNIVEHNKKHFEEIISNNKFYISPHSTLRQYSSDTHNFIFHNGNMLLSYKNFDPIVSEIESFKDDQFYEGFYEIINKDCNIITPWV